MRRGFVVVPGSCIYLIPDTYAGTILEYAQKMLGEDYCHAYLGYYEGHDIVVYTNKDLSTCSNQLFKVAEESRRLNFVEDIVIWSGTPNGASKVVAVVQGKCTRWLD